MKKRLFAVLLCLVLVAAQLGAAVPSGTAEPAVSTGPAETTAEPDALAGEEATEAENSQAPAATAEPQVTAQPADIPDADPTTEAAATAEPEATAGAEEPETTAGAESTAAPEDTAEPASSAEPAGSVEPSATPADNPDTAAVLPSATPAPVYVAAVGETKYESLEEAWAQASATDGSSLTLLRDTTVAAPLTLAAGSVIFHGGAYTLKTVDGPVFRISGGKLTVADGILAATLSKEQEEVYAGSGIVLSAVEVTGGTLEVTGGQVNSEATAVSVSAGELLLSGGSLTGGKHAGDAALLVSGEASVKISGGALTGTNGLQVQGGTVALSGGKVASTGTALSVSGGAVSLSGGDLSGERAVQVASGSAADLLAEGVTYLAEGQAVAEEILAAAEIAGSVSLGQAEEPVYVAEVALEEQTSSYLTMEEAWAAAKAMPGSVVTLLQDVSTVEALTVVAGESVTFDGGEYVLTRLAAQGEEGSAFHVQGGSLTLTGGTVTGGTRGALVEDGTLTVAGGSLAGSEDGICAKAGTVSVRGGSVTGGVYGVEALGATAEISDGAVTAAGEGALAAVTVDGGQATLSGGTFTGGWTGLYAYETKNVTLSGGSFTGQEAAVAVADGQVVADLLAEGFTFETPVSAGTMAAEEIASGEEAKSEPSGDIEETGETAEKTEAPEESSGPDLTGDVIPGTVQVVPENGEAEADLSLAERWDKASESGETLVLTEDTAVAETLVVDEGQSLVLEGGEFVLSAEGEEPLIRVKTGGSLTIRSGSLQAELGPCVVVENGAVLVVEGGEIAGSSYGIVASGSVSVTGGAVAGGTYALCVVGSEETVNDQAIGAEQPETVALHPHEGVTLSGGTFTSDYAALYAEDPQAVTLTGGVYIGGEAAVAVPDALAVGEMLAEGYEYKQDGETIQDTEVDTLSGSVSVLAAASGAVAEVTIEEKTTEYDTLEEAWAAASAAENALVTLKADVTLSAPLTLEKDHAVTLESAPKEEAAPAAAEPETSAEPGENPGTDPGEQEEPEEGYTITDTGTSVFTVSGGELTIQSGAIAGGDYAVRASGEATLTIAGGSVTADRYSVTGTGSTVTIAGGTITSDYTGVYLTGGTAEISGGTIVSTNEEAGWGVTVTENGKLTVSGGEITGTGEGSGLYADGAEAEITGGTISGGANGIRAVQTGKVTLTDGVIKGEKFGIALAEGAQAEVSGGDIASNCGIRVGESTATITGGTITTETYGVYVSEGHAVIGGETVIDSQYNGACLFGGTLDIEGGSIKGIGEETGWGVYVATGVATVSGGEMEGKRYGIQANDPATVSLSGGTFTGEFAVKTGEGKSVGVMLQSGCVFLQNGAQVSDVTVDGLAGTVSVEQIGESKAARVLTEAGSVEYNSLAEAWAAAKGKTATVQLLSNLETSVPLTVEDGDAITLAGAFSLRGTGANVIDVSGGSFVLAGATVQGGECSIAAAAGAVTIQSGSVQATETAISAAGGTVTISGGTVNGDKYGLVCSNRSAVTFSAGTISSAYNGVFMSSGSLTMTGGTIRCSGTSGWAVYVRGGKVSVSDGTIAGTRYGILTTVSRYVSLSGGTYEGTSAVATAQGTKVEDMLAYGYRFMSNGSPADGSGNTLAGPLTVDKDPTATPTPKPTQKPAATQRPSSSGGYGGGSSSTSKNSPKTGDETEILPWTLLLAASGTALVVVLAKHRKKEK